MNRIDRRTFLKTGAALAVTTALMPRRAWAEAEKAADVIVVHGKDVKKMLAAGIERMGGWSAFVKPGKKVTFKPNIAWASSPEQGANTHPDIVRETMLACRAAGAKDLVVCENSCSPHHQSFEMSGVSDAVKAAKGRLYRPVKGSDFRPVSIPGGKVLKTAEVPVDVLDTDCLINMPVAKSHGGATLTLSMKNWMGSVKDRGFWHRSGLHQCIADFSTFLKADLIVVDATRIMLTNGPRGPGRMAQPEQLIFGIDPVAVDAYASTLFDMKPFDVDHIRMADEMGVGCGDLTKVNVEHINA